MTYRFQIMSSVEVGVAPGSYRIIDLFCFKEVLNQIMKVHRSLASLPILSFPFQCSCQSANGFGLFQQDSDVPNSFHSILDIVCRNCSQKVQKILKTFMISEAYFHFQISFGTSIIVDSFASGVLAKPDIDLRIESCFDHLEDNFSLARKLRQNLYHSSVADWRDDDDGGGEDTAVVTISAEQEISEAFHQQLQPSHQVARSSSLPSLTCGTCGKEFKKAFNLKQHVRTHTNEKPLKCARCEKRFNDRSSMNKHVRTVHSDIRPHPCLVCGKCFTTNSHLTDHQATHTQQKRFHCLQCGKRFAFRSSLKKHIVCHDRLNWSNKDSGTIQH